MEEWERSLQNEFELLDTIEVGQSGSTAPYEPIFKIDTSYIVNVEAINTVMLQQNML